MTSLLQVTFYSCYRMVLIKECCPGHCISLSQESPVSKSHKEVFSRDLWQGRAGQEVQKCYWVFVQSCPWNSHTAWGENKMHISVSCGSLKLFTFLFIITSLLAWFVSASVFWFHDVTHPVSSPQVWWGRDYPSVCSLSNRGVFWDFQV